MRDRRVAVVGAGLAGLAAARQLTRRGCEVTLVERESEPGGRARSRQREGFTLEPGVAVVSSGDGRLLAWIDEVGARDELLPLRPVVEARFGRSGLREIDPRRLSGIAKIPGVRRRHALRLLRLPRLLRRYGSLLDPEQPARAAPWDDRSLADFGRLYFGRSVLTHWMAPSVRAAALGGEDETSRVLFLLEQARHAARPGLLRAPLGELGEAAARGLDIRFGVECTAVEPREGNRLDLVLRGPRGAERPLSADAVVLATEAGEAARLAAGLSTPAERDGLLAVRYAPSLVLSLALRRPFSPHPQLVRVPSVQGSPLASVLLEPGVAGGRVPRGHGMATLRATASWSAAHFEVPGDVLEKELVGALESLRPNAGAAVLFSQLFRVRRALPRFDVGRYREIARFESVQQDRRRAGRRLYFAGDYRVAPSWEGAVVSGQQAASDLESDLASGSS